MIVTPHHRTTWRNKSHTKSKTQFKNLEWIDPLKHLSSFFFFFLLSYTSHRQSNYHNLIFLLKIWRFPYTILWRAKSKLGLCRVQTCRRNSFKSVPLKASSSLLSFTYMENDAKDLTSDIYGHLNELYSWIHL